jgi:hypothetical protein
MDEKSYIQNIYELYFKCVCPDGPIKLAYKKTEIQYNIELMNCRMLKGYPFNTNAYYFGSDTFYKKRYMMMYADEYGEEYKDNLTPCERKELLEK